jgi:hypothetical protein
MVKPPAQAPDLAGVFAVELRKQDEEENYSGNQRASRGLEEEDERGLNEGETAGSNEGTTVNFFA